MILIFDLDNTLIHSRIDFLGIRAALSHWALENGLSNTNEFQNMPISQIISRIETDFGPNSKECQQVWEIVEDFEEKGMSEATISSDVIPALKQLRKAGIKTALFTNNSSKSALPAIANFGLGPFDVVKTRDNVQKMKPSGAGLLEILQILSGNQESTYLVGDSWVDGLCAQDAGIKFIAFGSEHFAQIEERGIPYYKRVSNMKQLVDFAERYLSEKRAVYNRGDSKPTY